ncbi:MFS transporter [Phytohabitans suffuscus]|uniref:MFS transporter n=1 Tax=Phytohabitans suffuscus TaxID=624315 RepID=A0A6F8YYL2_9ACTN|nr:MFS transporter [Phytohabitans suffuscus]BCB91169.1 MFS transporter [Phytohabitans suffuscus]
MPTKAGPRSWLALAVLCLPTMLAVVDINVLFLALPRLSADLGAGSAAQLWIMDVYGFMIAGFLVTMGNLGDRIGHRKVLLTGAAVFMAASVLAAYSSSVATLVGARAVLGVAAATVMPSVLALIRDLFTDPRQLGAAYGVWGTSIMVGVVVGPSIGGLLLGAYWWGAAFLIGVPVMGLLLVTGPFLVPESRERTGGRLDPLSVALSLAAILPFVYGLKEIARGGPGPLAVAALAVGLASGAVFVSRQRRLASPLLDLRLFADRGLRGALTLAFVLAFTLAGVGLVVTQYLQVVKGLSPLAVGLWMLPPSLAMIVAGNLGPALARTVRPAYIFSAGLVLAAAAALASTRIGPAAGIGWLVAALFVLYVGTSPIGVMSNTIVMTSAPPEKAGSAGSLSSTSGEFGLALGVAVFGSIATAAFRDRVEVPAGVPADLAGKAGENVVGATTVAGQLPGPAGGGLLESAQAAFTGGMHVVLGLAAVLFAALAVVSIVTLRHVPPSGRPAPAPDAAPGHDEEPALSAA